MMAEFTRKIPVRINEEQYAKYEKSRYTKFSEFARDAIDAYDCSYVELKLKFFKEFQELYSNQLEVVFQNVVSQNQHLENTIDELEEEKHNLKQQEHSSTTENNDFENRIQPIISTLQALKHGENGLTNSNIEFQAKKVGVDTGKLKRWINAHPEIMNESPPERDRVQSEASEKVHK